MKVKIEVPDETYSLIVSCFDDSGFFVGDAFTEHENLEIIEEDDMK